MVDLDRDGFVVLPKFVTHCEVKEMADLIESALRSPVACVCSRPHNSLFPLRWNDDLVRLMLALANRIELLRAASEADDLRWISGYISIKEARSPALWWHQDWWCWDHPVSYRRAAPQIAVLCYLGSTTAGNGALRLLPGSHHKSTRLHAVLQEAGNGHLENLDSSNALMKGDKGEITMALNAGDAVLIDYRLLHGTHANDSDVRRDCVILNFTPSWGNLPEEIRSHLICHTALPSKDELLPPSLPILDLLPTFTGMRKDLPLSREAPAEFEVTERVSASFGFSDDFFFKYS